MILEVGVSRFDQGEAVMPDVQARQRADDRVELHLALTGQLLAQSLVAGAIGQHGLAVKTIQTVFARGVSPCAALASPAPAR